MDYFEIQSNSEWWFDEYKTGPHARSWNEKTMRGATLIKGGAKWVLQSWTADAVACRRTLPVDLDWFHNLPCLFGNKHVWFHSHLELFYALLICPAVWLFDIKFLFIIICSSDADSWGKAMALLVQVASHGERTGFKFPCLIVRVKDDLDPSPVATLDSLRVCYYTHLPSHP